MDESNREQWWDWFARVKTTLAARRGILSDAKRALRHADYSERASVIGQIEERIAALDRDAITADLLTMIVEHEQAIEALGNVSRKLDLLSLDLTSLVVERDGITVDFKF